MKLLFENEIKKNKVVEKHHQVRQIASLERD
jgi:hypothetical protein